MEDEDLIWAAVSAAVTLGIHTLVQKALAREWRSRRGVNPAGHDTRLGEAVLYAAASGAAVALTRVVVERLLRSAKRRRPRLSSAPA